MRTAKGLETQTIAVLAALVAALPAAALPVAAMAQASFTIPFVVDFEDPEFQPYYEYLTDELDASIVDGRLVVETAIPAGSCRFSSLNLAEGGTRATHVELSVDLGPRDADDDLMHGAGLMIRHDLESGSRFFAYLMQDQGYDIVAFVDGAIGQRIGGSTDAAAGTVRLAAREAGGGAEFFLNGEAIGGFSDSRVQGTGLALIFCGPGRYVFDNWGINSRGDVGFTETAEDPQPRDEITIEPASTAATGPVGGPAGGPPPMPEAVWWVDDNGTPLGPLTLPQLQARLADGRSTAATLVWRDGMASWTPAATALP
jgi:hypothetical protein